MRAISQRQLTKLTDEVRRRAPELSRFECVEIAGKIAKAEHSFSVAMERACNPIVLNGKAMW